MENLMITNENAQFTHVYSLTEWESTDYEPNDFARVALIGRTFSGETLFACNLTGWATPLFFKGHILTNPIEPDHAKIEYYLLEAETPNEFTDHANGLSRKGWKPAGNLYVHHRYCQMWQRDTGYKDDRVKIWEIFRALDENRPGVRTHAELVRDIKKIIIGRSIVF